MQYKLIISEESDNNFPTFLKTQIKEFNNRISAHHKAARQPGAVVPLNLILVDEQGEWIGGLSARTFWERWMWIDDFYIPDELRGQGLGFKLLRKAEEIAFERGCKSCALETFGFQARGFYEKHGYVVVGELKDYPPGSSFYTMRKDF